MKDFTDNQREKIREAFEDFEGEVRFEKMSHLPKQGVLVGLEDENENIFLVLQKDDNTIPHSDRRNFFGTEVDYVIHTSMTKALHYGSDFDTALSDFVSMMERRRKYDSIHDFNFQEESKEMMEEKGREDGEDVWVTY